MHAFYAASADLFVAAIAVCLLVANAAELSTPPEAAQRAETFRRHAAEAGWAQGRTANSDERARFTFWVRLQNTDKLKRILDNVSDPTNPDYGHFLTKRQTDALVKPRREDVDAVENALQGYEFTEQQGGQVISAELPIGAATRLLGGSFVYFCPEAGRTSGTHSCALRNPTGSIPLTLRDAVDIITPLDDPLMPVNSGPIMGPIPTDGAVLQEGCCFSIGFGDLMKPCCLKVEMTTEDGCKVGRRIGGATGFRLGVCPDSSDEAAALLKQASSATEVAPPALAADAGASSSPPPRGAVVAAVLALGVLVAGVVVLLRPGPGGRDFYFFRLESPRSSQCAFAASSRAGAAE